MSNGENTKEEMSVYERWFKLTAMIYKMVMDGPRDLAKVNDHLQEIVDDAEKFGPDKFSLLMDLGIITVPEDYDHATWLTKFWERHQSGEEKSFSSYGEDITDEHFPNPSRILKPGDKLRVCAFAPVVQDKTSSEERMSYLETQGMTVYTGAQGASLVFDQKRQQLPKGKWYASFDRAKSLWDDGHGRHRVPSVRAESNGDFYFSLGNFEVVWSDEGAFLGFCDLPADEAEVGAK